MNQILKKLLGVVLLIPLVLIMCAVVKLTASIVGVMAGYHLIKAVLTKLIGAVMSVLYVLFTVASVYAWNKGWRMIRS